jgi:hypothetical protein
MDREVISLSSPMAVRAESGMTMMLLSVSGEDNGAADIEHRGIWVVFNSGVHEGGTSAMTPSLAVS